MLLCRRALGSCSLRSLIAPTQRSFFSAESTTTPTSQVSSEAQKSLPPSEWNIRAMQLLVDSNHACNADIVKQKKREALLKYQRAPNDFGSSQAQIAMMSVRIKALTEHDRLHKKDKSSKRSLLTLVSKRRALLKYLKRTDYHGYQTIREQLGLARV